MSRNIAGFLLPESVYNRHDKLGFVSPEEVWIRNHPERFRKELEESCSLLEGIVDKKKLLEWFDDRLSNNKEFGYSFWKIISVARWMKVFQVKS